MKKMMILAAIVMFVAATPAFAFGPMGFNPTTILNEATNSLKLQLLCYSSI